MFYWIEIVVEQIPELVPWQYKQVGMCMDYSSDRIESMTKQSRHIGMLSDGTK